MVCIDDISDKELGIIMDKLNKDLDIRVEFLIEMFFGESGYVKI